MPENIDDKLLAEKKKEQDEFSDAFDELEGKDPELHKALHGDDDILNKDVTKGDALKPDATDKTPVAKDKDVAPVAKDGAVAQVDNTNTGVNTDLFDGLKDKEPTVTIAQGDDPKDAKIAELTAALKAEQQKTSSWDGRIKSANTRADDAEAKAKSLEERIAALETGKSESVAAAQTGDKNEQIAKFFSDFPEFEAPIRALIAESQNNGTATGVTLDEVKEAILPEVDQKLTKATETSSQDRFMSDLKVYHEDVGDLINSGEIVKWIELQPAYIAKELERVYNGGTVEEAKALVDEFKRTSLWYKTKTNTQSTPNPKKDDKLNSMLEVDSDSAGPPAGAPDKTDFDAAADEAFPKE